jgi:hypothetical protein
VEDRSKRQTYTQKQARSYANSVVEHVCNGDSMDLEERGKGKENDKPPVILHNIRCEGRVYKDVLKAVEKWGVGVKG